MIRRTVLLSAVMIAVVGAGLQAGQGGATNKPQSAATNKPGSLELTVSTESGGPVADAKVVVRGPADRAGTTGNDGAVTLVNLPVGTYRCRITRDGYVMMEKEIIIRPGARATAEAVLTAAPPPPPPPPPSAPPPPVTKPATSELKAGQPSIEGIAEMADSLLRTMKTPTAEKDLGCSGATASRLIVTKENITMHTHADADEMIYIVAGEATMTVGDKDQPVSAAWFSVVPRGMSHSLMRRGRNPLVVLSVRSGPPCPGL